MLEWEVGLELATGHASRRMICHNMLLVINEITVRCADGSEPNLPSVWLSSLVLDVRQSE